jgi:hypothetical protein
VGLGAIDWEEASLPVLSEAGCGEWNEALGRRVVEHRGRLWVEWRRCFFQPVHHLAKLSAHEATRPARSCLGFRARLAEDAWQWANGSLPAHTFPDPQSSWTFGDLAGLWYAIGQGEITRAGALAELGRIARTAVRADVHVTWFWRDPLPTIATCWRYLIVSGLQLTAGQGKPGTDRRRRLLGGVR